jgi:hypothetical protein
MLVHNHCCTARIQCLCGLGSGFGAPWYINDFAEYFNVGIEQNIPTLYSVLIWTSAAAITGLIAHFEASKNPFQVALACAEHYFFISGLRRGHHLP